MKQEIILNIMKVVVVVQYTCSVAVTVTMIPHLQTVTSKTILQEPMVVLLTGMKVHTMVWLTAVHSSTTLQNAQEAQSSGTVTTVQ